MSASALQLSRTVVGIKTLFFLEGVAFTSPSAGTAGAAAKPDIADTGWLNLGHIKWSEESTSKIEDYMEPSPGAYAVTDRIVTSKGLKYTGKFEKQSPFALRLQRATAALASTAGTVYNPLAGSPVVRAWVHQEMRDVNDVLLDTVDVWCALEAAKSNRDDKPSETDITATVLYSTLNVGTLG